MTATVPFHFRYKPRGGKMILEFPQQMRNYLEVSEAKKPDEWHEGDLCFPKKKRSNQQNRTLMGFWMPLIMEEEYGTPYTEAEMLKVYGEIKMEMNWTIDKVNKKTGEVRKFPRDTHDLDSGAYTAWMEDFARHIAAEHNIFLPDPDPAKARI